MTQCKKIMKFFFSNFLYDFCRNQCKWIFTQQIVIHWSIVLFIMKRRVIIPIHYDIYQFIIHTYMQKEIKGITSNLKWYNHTFSTIFFITSLTQFLISTIQTSNSDQRIIEFSFMTRSINECIITQVSL